MAWHSIALHCIVLYSRPDAKRWCVRVSKNRTFFGTKKQIKRAQVSRCVALEPKKEDREKQKVDPCANFASAAVSFCLYSYEYLVAVFSPLAFVSFALCSIFCCSASLVFTCVLLRVLVSPARLCTHVFARFLLVLLRCLLYFFSCLSGSFFRHRTQYTVLLVPVTIETARGPSDLIEPASVSLH